MAPKDPTTGRVFHFGVLTFKRIRSIIKFSTGELMFTDSELAEFLEKLGDLSVEGETFEICLSALKLQTALKEVYGDNFL